MAWVNPHYSLKSLAEVSVAASVLFKVHMKIDSSRKEKKIKKKLRLKQNKMYQGKFIHLS